MLAPVRRLLPSCLLVAATVLVACGGETTQEAVLRPSDVPAERLVTTAMEIEMEGDTSGMSSHETREATSPDGGKIAWCDGGTVYVADTGGTGRTQTQVHTVPGSARGRDCFKVRWLSDDKLRFVQIESDDTLSQPMTVTLTLGVGGDEEADDEGSGEERKGQIEEN